MGINECSQPASKSSWDSQDFGDVNLVLKMVHFRKSSPPQWVNWVSIGSGNGLFPNQHQAITWTNVDLWSIGPSWTNFSEILIKIQQLSHEKKNWKCYLQYGRHFVPSSIC